MYCGKFEDIMPFDKQEQDLWIERMKQALNESETKDHSYTNFEICALRTIKAMQQEIERQKEFCKDTKWYLENKHLLVKENEHLKQEIEQLQAQNKAMRGVDKQKDAIIHQCFLTLQMCRVDGLSVDADFLAEQAILEIEKLGKAVEK